MTLAPARFCSCGGLLVDAETRLPTDPCEYYRKDVRVLAGCNRLRCERCNEWVRSECGEARLYACRCVKWLAASNNEIENDHESPTDPNVPWVCAGHPVPELPVTLGELTIGADTDWAELVDKILAGARPRALEPGRRGLAEGPSLWLGWLYAYLAGLPLADQLSSAIGERAGDRDPLVVGRVLTFFSRFPRAPGVEHVIARAEAAVDQIAVGYPIPEYSDPPTVWEVLVARLEQRSDPRNPLDERTAEVVRKALLSSPAEAVDKTFKRATTAFDDAELRLWIADNIVELDGAAKGRWRPLMNLLSDWYRKPELGHLIVIAGMRLIESRAVGVVEFRDWMKSRRGYGWVDDAWVLPLTTVLDQQSQKPLVN